MIVVFFTTSKCERPNHLFKATSQSASSVSGSKALKSVSVFCYTQLRWNVMERFRNCIRKRWTVCTKILLLKNYSVKKTSQTRFCCLCVNLVSLGCLAHSCRSFNYPGFYSKKRLGVFQLSLDGMLVHRRSLSRNLLGFPNDSPVPICTPAWREALWELSVLPKNTTLCSRPRLEPGPLAPGTGPWPLGHCASYKC